MIRFNRKGAFNIPFCRKPRRFARAYITKITNQVSHVGKLIRAKDFVFRRQSFEKTIAQASTICACPAAPGVILPVSVCLISP